MDQGYTGVFETNLTFLYLQYQIRIKLGFDPGEAPWQIFNRAMEEVGFGYRLKIPILTDSLINTEIELVNLENDLAISLESLSSGERTLMTLILAIYNSKNDQPFPDAILFDEPDAYLHPSMVHQMLKVFKKSFIEDKNVKVIITTHSPSTIALTPEPSLFKMSRKTGTLSKVTKSDAIKSLTTGLISLNVYYEHCKQVFVEDKFDEMFFKILLSKLLNHLNSEILIHFLASGSKDIVEVQATSNEGADKLVISTGNGKQRVGELVRLLNDAGNRMICGVVDGDNSGIAIKGSKIVKCGLGRRHSLENYIFDPIAFIIFLVQANRPLAQQLISLPDLNIVAFFEITDADLQEMSNRIISILETKNMETCDVVIENEKESVQCKLINGKVILLPKWFLTARGHDLENLYVNAIPYLRSAEFIAKGNQNRRKELMIDHQFVLAEFMSVDLLETFWAIEKLPIS
ncbi:hypothetical protein GCM10007423_39490 [Dyadobacter endophyticus]|uniref:Endonuclease GajA/Old nuclease/RecF-like AAA domain-containing protein n=1 Tax=Dyadobacter endophyticus TaxID=1749036 RepID=A0ABQ1YXV2_9BACT|nr:hypothetical protein GCM10007423_39490 [Dyadobacter endophyticus]